MIVTSCGNSVNLAKRLARKLKATYSPLTIKNFPDGELYLRFHIPLKKRTLYIVQSFQPKPDMSLFDILFAAETARDLGAKKIILVAPYLSFMRQDKRFHSGEAINSKIMANLLNNCIDKIITVDPHLHRYNSLKDIFTISTKKLTANSLIAKYIQKKIKNPVIIGPDWESYQWAAAIAKTLKCPVTVLEKKRFSARHVDVKMTTEIDLKGKNVVIVDDIISTGHTIAEAAKKARKLKAKTITAIAVHGLFAEKAIEKIKKAGVTKIITTNTIAHPTNKLDILELL